MPDKPMPDKPMPDKPWYHNGLKFKCTGCGACCTGEPGYVWVNKAEIAAIAAAIKIDVETFERRYTRRVGIRKSLVELPNGDCVFFDSERRICQIYAERPRQCRTWPFWASYLRTPKTWAEVSEHCPGASRGRLVPLEEIELQAEVLRV